MSFKQFYDKKSATKHKGSYNIILNFQMRLRMKFEGQSNQKVGLFLLGGSNMKIGRTQ